MRKIIATILIAALMSGSVVAGDDVTAYCRADWPGDVQSQRDCVKNGGADVFAHNTAKHKWRKFGRHITAEPATKADESIVQADVPSMPYAMGVWTGLLFLITIGTPAAPLPIAAMCL